jgi:outer membrane protein assembly factor BamD (BamD/ComL family)
MHCRQTLVAMLSLVLLAGGCASLALPTTAAGDPNTPGTPAWWKKNKKHAEMVPGHGNRVDGVDGYFDANGVPLNSRVTKVVDKPDEGGGLLNDVGFQKGVGQVKERLGFGPDQQEAQRQYELGEANFRGEKFDDAADNYKAAAAGWPNSTLAQDALYKYAESLFFADRYPAANNAYEDLLKKFPNSRYLDNAITRQFAIARYWEQYADYNPNWVTTPNLINKRLPLFDTLGRAIKTYENIRLNDPTGPLADDAIMATANSYFRRGRWNDADYQYDLLREEYARSDHRKNAYILGFQCKMRRYQGADYDGTPLEEAQQLAKEMKTQFGAELEADFRQSLAENEGQIQRELATREMKMAQHFDGIEEYGAARFYYAQVAKNYPSTPLGDEAKARIAEIGALPERPEPKLAWLIDKVPLSSEQLAIKQVPLLEQSTLGPQSDGRQMIAAGSGENTEQSGGGSGEPTIRR